MSTRRYLTAEEYRRCKRVLHRALQANAAAWNATGWSVIGRSRIRIAMHVPCTLSAPAVPVGTIPLPLSVGGGFLKPAVKAIHSHRPARQPPEPPPIAREAFTGAAESDAVAGFAPGAAVQTPGGRGGVAAFVSNADGIFVLTCGHTFQGGTAVEHGGAQVGTLVENLLRAHKPIDAALCRLNQAGVEAANASADAPTWFGRVHTPADSDNDRDATVYPTHHGAGLPFTETIASFSACETIDGLQLCELVVLPECTVRGDSGTLLAIDGEYLGICRGSTGHHSCFTPVRTAILRLRDTFPGLRIWRPT